MMDHDGNLIRETEEQFFELEDLGTGETKYLYQERHEMIEPEEDLYYPNTRMLRALFDLEKNQLTDWEEVYYEPAFGEFVIKYDSGSNTSLYHVPTRQETVKDVYNVIVFGKHFLLCDGHNYIIDAVDSKAQKTYVLSTLEQFRDVDPLQDYAIMRWGPYGKDTEPKRYLIDQDFKILYAFDQIRYSMPRYIDQYFIYEEGGAQGIVHPEQGILFTVQEGSIAYYDGELAIVTMPDGSMSLVNRDHEVIAAGCNELTPLPRSDDHPAYSFLYVQENQAILISRTGGIIRSVEIPDLEFISAVSEGLYIYRTRREFADGGYYSWTGVLDTDFNIIVPMGIYVYIDVLPNISTSSGDLESIVLLASRTKDFNPEDYVKNYFTYELLDAMGNVLADEITTVYDTGPDRIVFRRGYKIMMIDRKGNVIAEHSIFQYLMED